MNHKTLLVLGAGANFSIAVLHLIIIFLGTPAYLYFGTADLAVMASAGSFVPSLVTMALAFIFFGFGLYGLSGVGAVRHLPLLIPGLLGIGSLYTLRGLIVILDLLRLFSGADYPFRQTLFSAVSLIVGICYLVGTARGWKDLARSKYE